MISSAFVCLLKGATRGLLRKWLSHSGETISRMQKVSKLFLYVLHNQTKSAGITALNICHFYCTNYFFIMPSIFFVQKKKDHPNCRTYWFLQLEPLLYHPLAFPQLLLCSSCIKERMTSLQCFLWPTHVLTASSCQYIHHTSCSGRSLILP